MTEHQEILAPVAAAASGLPVPAGSASGRDRKAYLLECEARWSGPALMNARLNWRIFEENYEAIVGVLTPYLRDNMCEDLTGKMHNPEGTLTAWLWKVSDQKENWWVWDFCEHYQKCHLRRGLIAYCKQVIAELGKPNTAICHGRAQP